MEEAGTGAFFFMEELRDVSTSCRAGGAWGVDAADEMEGAVGLNAAFSFDSSTSSKREEADMGVTTCSIRGPGRKGMIGAGRELLLPSVSMSRRVGRFSSAWIMGRLRHRGHNFQDDM